MSRQNHDTDEHNITVSDVPAKNKRSSSSNEHCGKSSIKKHQSKMKWSTIKSIIDISTFFILVLTLCVSTLTIFEMRKERNESYKAIISTNPVYEAMLTNIDPVQVLSSRNFQILRKDIDMKSLCIVGYLSLQDWKNTKEPLDYKPCYKKKQYY